MIALGRLREALLYDAGEHPSDRNLLRVARVEAPVIIAAVTDALIELRAAEIQMTDSDDTVICARVRKAIRILEGK